MLDDVNLPPTNQDSVATPTQTSAVRVVEAPDLTVTQPTLNQLTDEMGHARHVVTAIHEQVDDLHQRLRAQVLAGRAKRIKESGVQLLDELAALGFAWRHIAQLVGVSVPAVQKWRRGERMSAENLAKVAELLATCDLVHSSFFVTDVAAWFEIPIMPPVPVRPMDLYSAGHVDLVLDWVSHQETDPEAMLTKFDPNWREHYASDFEVFEADDGQLSLRRKDQ